MGTDFGPLADRYDEFRPADENWWALLEALVEEGDLRGRRVLEIGCGTGRLAAALADRHAAKAWAIDPSPEMVAVARGRMPRGSAVRVGLAEQLPFRDAWFERAVMRLVVHLVDRAQALPELHRVLVPGGRAVIATFDPGRFGEFWLNRVMPSLDEIDRARFPDPEALAGELRRAGFASTRVTTLDQQASLSRDEALERIRGRFISALSLIDDEEYERGLAVAEHELPERVEYRIPWVIVIAER